MAKKKNTAGTNARKNARMEDAKSVWKRTAGYGIAGSAGLVTALSAPTVFGAAATVGAGVAAATTMERSAKKSDAKAQAGRGRAAALDYMAQRGKGGTKAADLVRGSVSVTRGGKTFTQQRMIRAEPKKRGK